MTILDKSTSGKPMPSMPNFMLTPRLLIQGYDSKNWIDEILLSNRKNSSKEITNDNPELRSAIERACSLVLVRNVMIAPIKGIAIINEIKAAIYVPPNLILSKSSSKPIPNKVMEA
jgi:hypothetical protein